MFRYLAKISGVALDAMPGTTNCHSGSRVVAGHMIRDILFLIAVIQLRAQFLTSTLHGHLKQLGFRKQLAFVALSFSVLMAGLSRKQKILSVGGLKKFPKKSGPSFNMVLLIWKHTKHQTTSECWLWWMKVSVILLGVDEVVTAQNSGLWGKWRCRTEAVLPQIHIMLSFHLSPWEYKRVHAVLSWVCDSVNNNSWTCWGWCHFLDSLRWWSESLVSVWSCVTCGWSTGHSGLQGKIIHRCPWFCDRENPAIMWRFLSLHVWVRTSEKVFLISTFRFLSSPYQYVMSQYLCSSLDNPIHRFQSTFRFAPLPTIGRKKNQAYHGLNDVCETQKVTFGWSGAWPRLSDSVSELAPLLLYSRVKVDHNKNIHITSAGDFFLMRKVLSHCLYF